MKSLLQVTRKAIENPVLEDLSVTPCIVSDPNIIMMRYAHHAYGLDRKFYARLWPGHTVEVGPCRLDLCNLIGKTCR